MHASRSARFVQLRADMYWRLLLYAHSDYQFACECLCGCGALCLCTYVVCIAGASGFTGVEGFLLIVAYQRHVMFMGAKLEAHCEFMGNNVVGGSGMVLRCILTYLHGI